jgi:hypothetical protein
MNPALSLRAIAQRETGLVGIPPQRLNMVVSGAMQAGTTAATAADVAHSRAA